MASDFPSYSRAECGTVQGAQEHHRADEPLCELCQRWSDERHRRTRVPAGSRCGTPAGAQMHRQLGEKVCERCAPGRPKKPARKIRITVDLPWSGVPNVEEYYDLPDGWDRMTPSAQQRRLEEMGAEELYNLGVGYGASVVEVPADAESEI